MDQVRWKNYYQEVPASGKSINASLQVGGGTGTFIHRDEAWGYVLTCAHVVGGPTQVELKFPGRGKRLGDFVCRSKDGDLSIVRFKLRGDEPAPVKIAAQELAAGTEVAQSGYPGAAGYQVPKKGTIGGFPSGHDMTIDFQVLPGESGSGVFANEELVGVCHSTTVDRRTGQPLKPAVCVRLGRIRGFLHRALPDCLTERPLFPGPKKDNPPFVKPPPDSKPQEGKPGRDGLDGKDGKPGRDGKDGQDGANGKPGRDGKDGIGMDPKILQQLTAQIVLMQDQFAVMQKQLQALQQHTTKGEPHKQYLILPRLKEK